MAKGQGAPSEKSQQQPQTQHHNTSPAPVQKGKTVEALPGMCGAQSCKTKSTRFSFCDEHYDQFKFGLINKHGAPVPDFEKKFGHYSAWKQRQSVRKVA